MAESTAREMQTKRKVMQECMTRWQRKREIEIEVVPWW